MRLTRFFLMFFLIAGVCFPKDIPAFTDFLRPEFVKIVDDEFFVNEGASVFVYSIEDYKLKYKFGVEGEGPQEFKVNIIGIPGHKICFTPLPDSIVVGSESKVSYFSRDAKFIREKRIPVPMIIDFTPLSKGFVGRNYKNDKGVQLMSVDLYDQEGIRLKEVCKHEITAWKKGSRVLWDLVDILPEFKTYNDHIFMAGGGDFKLDVYNSNGEKVRTIKHKYDRLKVGDSEREKIIGLWKDDSPRIRREWDSFFKKMIGVPDYLPAFRAFFIADNNIYFQTSRVEKDKTEFIIMGIDGKFKKQVFLPLRYRNIVMAFPYTISKNKLYQLFDNEEAEHWELFVTKIE